MSRKAKIPIQLPKGVTAKLEGAKLTVKGPKGTLVREIRPGISLAITDKEMLVSLDTTHQIEKNFLGLYWALVSNMVCGVTNGFDKKLEMVGVGFRAQVMGKEVDLQIGKSHPTRMAIPDGIKVDVEKNTLITITGIDKQLVGQFAAEIRAKYKPEPYKGKGIRYAGEYVRKKAGKAGKAAGAKEGGKK